MAALVINNGKTGKNGKPHIFMVEDPVSIKLLEVIMRKNAKHIKTSFLLYNTSYAHCNKKIRNAAQY